MKDARRGGKSLTCWGRFRLDRSHPKQRSCSGAAGVGVATVVTATGIAAGWWTLVAQAADESPKANIAKGKP